MHSLPAVDMAANHGSRTTSSHGYSIRDSAATDNRPVSISSSSASLSSTPLQPVVDQNLYRESELIVQPIDKRIALQTHSYNPNSIARDVLVATSTDPQRRLNAHLEILQSRFTKVDHTSDLSTFRWDILERVDIPAGYASTPELMEANNFQRPENHASESNIDSADYETPEAVSTWGNSERVTPDLSYDRQSSSKPSPMVAIVVDNGFQRGTSYATVSDEGKDPVIASSSTSTGKRRGRPPRQVFQVEEEVEQVPKRRPGRPPKLVVQAEVEAEQAPRRRPGRPPKRLIDSVGKEADSPKRRIRKFRSENGLGRAEYDKRPQMVEPHFIPYRCGWGECPAELQNLDSLQRHVLGKHSSISENDQLVCLWTECNDLIQTDGSAPEDIQTSRKNLVFNDRGAWEKHVKEKHIAPYAWYMGDGPKGSSFGKFDYVPSYLA
jgi:hypothetical protein